MTHGFSILAVVTPMVFGIGGLAIAALLLWLSLRANRRKRLIDNLPTCPTTGVFIGTVELNGTAEAEHPLRSYLAEIPCVHYRWCVEEHWSRTVTETYTDSQGKSQTRTRHESGWKTVADGGDDTVFYLRDDHGIIRINPDGAKWEGKTVFNNHVHRSDPLYYAKGPAGAVADSDHKRRFTERAVPLHAMLYVLGHARLRDDVIAPEIAHDRDAPMFLISTRTEKQISTGLAVQFWLLGLLAIVVAAAGWIVADSQSHSRSGQLARVLEPKYVGIATAALGVWLVGWIAMAYNSMQDLRQRVRQAWANIDVQLKRRADLIPRLVEVVRGYRDHESRVQGQVALLRSQAAVTAPGQDGPDPQGCMKSLIAIREAYPDLKANESFLKLQESLSDTEQRIALAREYFNNIATFYNDRLSIIPDRFVCRLAGMSPQKLITARDFERAVVQVKFADTAPPAATPTA